LHGNLKSSSPRGAVAAQIANLCHAPQTATVAASRMDTIRWYGHTLQPYRGTYRE